MILTKHDCLVALSEMNFIDDEKHKEIVDRVIRENVPPKELIESFKSDKTNDIVNFYMNLNSKAHKIIKEILTCEGKPISNYIKIATSIITQGIIAIEHLYSDDNNTDRQNNFIECLGLNDLSKGIYEYFNTGNADLLIQSVNNNRNDVKLILD
jgi:hypothetical protein